MADLYCCALDLSEHIDSEDLDDDQRGIQAYRLFDIAKTWKRRLTTSFDPTQISSMIVEHEVWVTLFIQGVPL